MLVDRLRALGAADRVDEYVVVDAPDADDVADDAIDDARFFVGSHSPGERDDAGPHHDVDIIRIESNLLIESVADQRP